jgi:HK97 family phage major capsid protein
MATLSKGTLFPEKLIGDLVNQVKGKSSLAKLARQIPIAFNGNKEFTFTMDKEVDVVAENGAKGIGGVTVTPKTIVPIKIEYGARVSNEFMYASEEEGLNILKAFSEGFAIKAARGLDLMALHGVNPRTGLASDVIGNNNFDTAVTQTVAYNVASPDPDANIEAAVAQIQAAGYDVNGLIMAPAFANALASVLASTNGPKRYPELAWGANPGSINGLTTDINRTVSDMTADSGRAMLGDFSAFRWGYAKEIPMQIIEYGNPDNDSSAGDLKGHNQVYIRCELFLGWGIIDATAFSRIIAEPFPGTLTLTLSEAASLVGGTKVTIAETAVALHEYLIKINGTVPRKGDIVTDGEDGWADYSEGDDIAVHAGDKLVVVEALASTGAVAKAGTVVVAADKIKAQS